MVYRCVRNLTSSGPLLFSGFDLFWFFPLLSVLFSPSQVQRARIARASAAMALRQRAEKAQHDSDDAELESMIASMPVLFRERVRKQVLANRRQAARVANAIGGTNGARVMKGVSSTSGHEGKKDDSRGRSSSPLSLPVPVLTEVYHQGGFDKHIERQKEVRRRKAQLENKFRKFKWAPGHTIAQPFSFEARNNNRSSAGRASRRRRCDRPKSRISGYYGSLDLESARGMSSPGRKAVKKKKLRAKKKKKKKTGGAAAGAEKGRADTDTKSADAADADEGKKRAKKKLRKKKKKSGGVKSRIDSFQSKKIMRLTHAKRRDYVHSRGAAGTTLDNKNHEHGTVASLGNSKQSAAPTFR